MRKNAVFWIWLHSHYKILEFFTIAPVLTSTLTVCRWNRGDLSSLYIGHRVRYKYYKKNSRFGLAWSHPCIYRGLSRPTSVFRITLGVCNILSRLVEIWQYEGQKNLCWVAIPISPYSSVCRQRLCFFPGHSSLLEVFDDNILPGDTWPTSPTLRLGRQWFYFPDAKWNCWRPKQCHSKHTIAVVSETIS